MSNSTALHSLTQALAFMIKRHRYLVAVIVMGIFGIGVLAAVFSQSMAPSEKANSSSYLNFDFTKDTHEIRADFGHYELLANMQGDGHVLAVEKYVDAYALPIGKHAGRAFCKVLDFHANEYRCTSFEYGMNQYKWVWHADGKSINPDYAGDLISLPTKKRGNTLIAETKGLQ